MSHYLPIHEARLPKDAFESDYELLNLLFTGISGEVVRWAVKTLPNQRGVFIDALGTTSGNLNRFYSKEKLDKHQSEEVLDILKLIDKAAMVFGDLEIAQDWLDTPINALNREKPNDLLTTFLGRRLVSDALDAIHYGEFS